MHEIQPSLVTALFPIWLWASLSPAIGLRPTLIKSLFELVPHAFFHSWWLSRERRPSRLDLSLLHVAPMFFRRITRKCANSKFLPGRNRGVDEICHLVHAAGARSQSEHSIEAQLGVGTVLAD
jgi:hypothetical protein